MDKILNDHLATVRSRIESQKPTLIEIKRMARDAHRALMQPDIDPEDRVVTEAELSQLNTMVQELSPPEPTPAERLVELRQKGLHDVADALEHGLQVEELASQKRALEAKLPEATIDQLPALQAQIAEMDIKLLDANQAHPVLNRLDEAARLKQDAINLRESGEQLEALQTPELQPEAQRLQEASAQRMAEADTMAINPALRQQ